MKEYTDLFKNACLMQFTAKYWSCSKAIDQRVLQMKLNEKSNWLKGRKFLINPDLLGQIHTTQHQARNSIQKFALPFPITGINMIPKESLQALDERLKHFEGRYWERVTEFLDIYPKARELARHELGDLYSSEDYPANITGRFGFEWRYLALGVPAKGMFLTGETYEREKEKFHSLMDETRELAVTALRTEFAKVIEALVSRIGDNGSKKRINGAIFNKLHDFLNTFTNKNLFQDDVLAELTEQAKNIIGNTSVFSIQHDYGLQESIVTQMTGLQNTILESITDIPRRKIRMPQAMAEPLAEAA